MSDFPWKTAVVAWARRAVLLLGPLAFICATVGAAQQADVVRLPWEKWQVHSGNDARCASASATGCTLKDFHDPTGLNTGLDSWYRIEVILPTELRQGQDRALGALIQGFDPVYEVFVNGTDIGGSGNFETRRGPQDSRTILRLPSGFAAEGRLVIAVHTLGVDTSRKVGDFVPAVASYDHLDALKDADTLAYLRRSWQHYVCYAALGGAGLVFFLLFAVNTRLREYAWLGAILAQLPILRLGELALVVNLAIPSWLGLTIYSICNGLGAMLGIEFIFAFLGRPVPWSFRAVQFLGCVGFLQLLLLLPLPYSIFDSLARTVEGSIVHNMLIGAILIQAFSWILLIPGCFRSGLPEMRAIGIAVLFITFVEGNRQARNFGLPYVPQDFMLGELDFDLRPLAYLIFAVVMLIAMTFRLRRIQNRNREVEQEMAAAHSVQQILIPDYMPTIPGLAIENAYLPAQEVGGDFFQVLPLQSDAQSAFIVVGDVSGKGLKAAMTVSLIVGTLRTYAEFHSSPAELLAGLNRRLHGRGSAFATCLVLMIEPSGRVTIGNAAHPNPYLDGVEIATEANLPLGISLEVVYSETSIQLEPDQQFTLVTDGVFEARHATSRELFGFARTQAISSQSAGQIAEAARVFGLGAPQADDITVLTIERTAEHLGGLRSALP
jgi:hypothetical protein